MIEFNEKDKIFTLSNEHFSYVFHVNSLDILVKLYYGKRINNLSIENIEATNYLSGDCYGVYDVKNNKETWFTNPYFSGQYSPQEIPTYLSFDKRPPLVGILHSDGSGVTDFRYYSHEIVKGKKNSAILPHLRLNSTNSETLIVTLKDQKDEIYLKAYYTIIKDQPVLLRSNEIINKTNKEIVVEVANSLSLDLPSNDYKVLSIHGTYASDRELEENVIKHNTIVIDENAGGKGFYHNPVGMLKSLDATADKGEVIGFGLIYSGNFSFKFNGTQMEQTRVVLGLNEQDFSYRLEKDEVFETPEAFLVYSSEGSDKVTHAFHDIIRDYLLPNKKYNDEDVILLNSWEGTYFDFNTDKIISYLARAKEMGINLFVLDDGWFGKRNDDLSSLGDWRVNLNKIDLKKVVDEAHKLGLKFGLWLEPEMISFDSDLYREHPEYALYDHSLDPTTFRHQFVLDLTNPDVINNISKQIEDIFSTYKLDYCKWDFNRIITEPISQYLPKERQKEVFYRFTLGTYELLSRFVTKFPNVLLETCAGGGGRFDLGMLYYSRQIWGSDETDGVSRTYIQYATNLFYPLSVLGSHVSNRRYLTLKEKAAIAMFGTFGYELNPLKLSDDDIVKIREVNKLYLDNKSVIYNGDYYPLINPYEGNNFVSWSLVDKTKDNAVIFLMNYRLMNWRSRFLKVRGLDPNKKYVNSIDNKAYYGDFYMNIGLNYCDGRDNYTPQVFTLKAVNGK